MSAALEHDAVLKRSPWTSSLSSPSSNTSHVKELTTLDYTVSGWSDGAHSTRVVHAGFIRSISHDMIIACFCNNMRANLEDLVLCCSNVLSIIMFMRPKMMLNATLDASLVESS